MNLLSLVCLGPGRVRVVFVVWFIQPNGGLWLITRGNLIYVHRFNCVHSLIRLTLHHRIESMIEWINIEVVNL